MRIAVFYDGTYFYHASNHFNHETEIGKRLSISGIHDFVKKYISIMEETKLKDCQITESHYFRGRASANAGNDTLYGDRVFDEVLMKCGVTMHYLPLVAGFEKGVDVSLALEAYELAYLGKFDVAVLVTGDGDYVPLVRKLNSLGTKVMLVAFDYESTQKDGKISQCKTSKHLIESSNYSIIVDHELKHKTNADIPDVMMMFVE